MFFVYIKQKDLIYYCLYITYYKENLIESSPLNPTELLNTAAMNLRHLYKGDKLVVYVTGLTPATVAIIKFCSLNGIKLTLKHFDRDSNSYIDDVVFD